MNVGRLLLTAAVAPVVALAVSSAATAQVGRAAQGTATRRPQQPRQSPQQQQQAQQQQRQLQQQQQPGLTPAASGVTSGGGAAGGVAPVAAQPAVAPDPRFPTVEQLRQQLASQPAEVLKGVSKLMSIKGPQAAAYDRYELFMLRGEAALRTKAIPMAGEAFKSAQQETADPDKQAVARANEILVKKSRQTGYVPKHAGPPSALPVAGAGAAPGATASNVPGATPGAAPGAAAPPVAAQPAAARTGAGAGAAGIPIIEEADRKQAFAALLNDELTTAAPKLKTAGQAKTLAPIIEVARTLGDIRAVELAATGSANQTKQIGSTIGAQAHQMIDAAMAPMERQVEDIWSDASRQNVRSNRGGYRERGYGMHGLDSNQAKMLKDIVATTEKLFPVARDLAAVTGDAQLQGDAQKSEKLYLRAKEVLEFDYPNEGRDTSKSSPQPTTTEPGLRERLQPLQPGQQPRQPVQQQPQPPRPPAGTGQYGQ